jgi:hypothetical protein
MVAQTNDSLVDAYIKGAVTGHAPTPRGHGIRQGITVVEERGHDGPDAVPDAAVPRCEASAESLVVDEAIQAGLGLLGL